MNLSNNQRRVIALRLDFRSMKECAHTLKMSEGTVKSHMKRAREKIGARSFNELLRWARENL